MANAVAPNVRLPDIIGTITRAHSSPDATRAMQEVSHIGQFVSNNSKSARFHENGILRYAQTVTELDVSFLEQIRDEAGQGMDAFDMIASMDEPASSKQVSIGPVRSNRIWADASCQVKLASYLLTVLERIGARLEAYYAALSQESIYRPEIENNPARTRWNNVRRKIADGSFFVLAKPPSMSASDGLSPGLRSRPGPNGVEVDFAQIFASAQQTLQLSPQSMSVYQDPVPQQPRRLADMHTARAANNTQAPSTFDMQQQGTALRRMSTFINDNMSTIRRLSRLPAEYDFASLMATYGKHPQQAPSAVSRSHTQTPSVVSNRATQSLRVRGNTGTGSTSPLPAPAPLRVRTRTPSLEKSFQLNHRQPSAPPTKDLPQLPQMPPAPSSTSPPVSASNAMNAAMAHLNRRQPPRSSTPLPASPRASLALSSISASSRRKMSGDEPPPPVPGMPVVPPGLRALKLAASVNGDEMRFQQVQARV